jgi:hypothetical protein
MDLLCSTWPDTREDGNGPNGAAHPEVKTKDAEDLGRLVFLQTSVCDEGGKDAAGHIASSNSLFTSIFSLNSRAVYFSACNLTSFNKLYSVTVTLQVQIVASSNHGRIAERFSKPGKIQSIQLQVIQKTH